MAMTKTGIRLLGWVAVSLTALAPQVVPAQTPELDLNRIPRSLVKEPAYRTAPRYCLLALGPAAKSRVWLAVDGADLYVDRNRNGVLTEAGEKVAGKDGLFTIGTLVEADGKTRYTGVTLGLDRKYESGDGKFLVKPFELHAVVRGLYEMAAEPIFAPKAADAPIVHFGGPLTMRVFDPRLVTKGQRVGFRCLIRTPGLGEQAEATVFHARIPESVAPNLAAEFVTSGVPPTHETAVLRTRC